MSMADAALVLAVEFLSQKCYKANSHTQLLGPALKGPSCLSSESAVQLQQPASEDSVPNMCNCASLWGPQQGWYVLLYSTPGTDQQVVSAHSSGTQQRQEF